MSKVEYCASEKLTIIEEIESGELGFMAAAYKYGVSKTTLVKWQRQDGGQDALQDGRGRKKPKKS